MTIIIIIFLLVSKQDAPTSLPIKSFAEVAQVNPYITGSYFTKATKDRIIKTHEEIEDEWAAYKS